MPHTAGPYFEVATETGLAPFYALRYDKHGRSQSPLTERHAVAAVTEDVTDVFVFSHGWNNDFATALHRYKAFIQAFHGLRDSYGLEFHRSYRPLLVGIFWPSTALVLPWERGPDFAGDEDAQSEAVDLSLRDAAAETSTDPQRVHELAERGDLAEDEARELLGLVFPAGIPGDADLLGDPARDVEELLAAWAMVDAATDATTPLGSADDFGAVGEHRRTDPRAAGLLDKLNPRNLFRLMTVMEMKDRAGVVGTSGVGPLLARLQTVAADEARFHVVGHSYGARVLLVAVGHPTGEPLPRPVQSMLLLQPAVNHLCFADALPDGREGGFRQVPAKVALPILSTFSAHDFPLTRTFHLALRRGKDLAEAEIAADEPPSEYAALGGYGPRGFAGSKQVDMLDPTDRYELGDGAPELWAVNATQRISGHGDVVNASTAWALWCLAST